MAMANDKQIGGSHYRAGIQHWDYVISNHIPYLEAQVMKYLTRWRQKNGFEDLLKAQHFLQKLFESEGFAWDPSAAALGITGAAEAIHVEGCQCVRCIESRAKDAMLTQAGAGIPRYTTEQTGQYPNTPVHLGDPNIRYRY